MSFLFLKDTDWYKTLSITSLERQQADAYDFRIESMAADLEENLKVAPLVSDRSEHLFAYEQLSRRIYDNKGYLDCIMGIVRWSYKIVYYNDKAQVDEILHELEGISYNNIAEANKLLETIKEQAK